MKYYIFVDGFIPLKVSKSEFFSFIKSYESKLGVFIEEEPTCCGFDYVLYLDGFRSTIGFSVKS